LHNEIIIYTTHDNQQMEKFLLNNFNHIYPLIYNKSMKNKLIKDFNISKEWMLFGKGEMFS